MPFTVFTVFTVCRFAVLSVLPFCHFGFTVLHFAVSIFTGRFAVLPFYPISFCCFAVPFRRFAVLANSVLIPFTVLTAESLIKSKPFCRFRFDRFDAHFLLPI